jgi:tetratricopeptide (TPR) repeat protein
MADCSLFGESAAGLHLVNVGFHLANTLLILLLLWQMTGAVWRSGFVAALFALHPLHVESVAWIAERKDVLSTFFGLLTLLAYVRYVRAAKAPSGKSKLWYGLGLVCFALGLMSKPMLVTWPFVMLLLDYWPLLRFEHNVADSKFKRFLPLVREKLPFFALSAASSAITFWAQKTGGAVIPLKNIPLPGRLANAAVSYVMYLAKAFWPTKLAVPYPFVVDLPAMKVALAVVFLLGTTVLAFIAARRAPYLLVGWLWFIGTLVPVIGLLQVGVQAMADRYTYIPLVGVFVIITWGAVELSAGWLWQRLALPALAALTLTGGFIGTRFQVAYWRNNLALFSHTLQVTKDNPVAEQCFGFALALCGNEDDAVQHFDAALRLWPDYLPARLDRGIALMLGGRTEDALEDFREAIRLQPGSEKAYYQLAGALAQQKKLAEAKANYLLALRCQPGFAEAHMKLGKLLMRLDERADAMSHLYEAVRVRPDYAEGQYALGNELAQQENFPEAVIHLRAAIRAQPNYASPLNDLAWILATEDDPGIRNVPEAIRLAKRACELTWNREPRLLATLGVAQSESGQFSAAIKVTEQAAALAAGVGDEQTTTELRRRLEFYRKGKPFRDIPRQARAASGARP